MLRPAADVGSRLDARDSRREAAVHVKPAWHGRAFLVEALVMLVFLLVSLAVLLGVFSNARVESAQAQHQTNAIHLAQNAAELFAANPPAADGLALGEDGLAANVQVEEEPREAGTLYRAVITVTDVAGVGAHEQGQETYRLQTARYVPYGAELADIGAASTGMTDEGGVS